MPAGWVFWPATNRSISSRIPGGYNSCWTSRCIRQRPQRHGRGVWTREVRDQISTWLADTVPDPVGQPPPDPKVGREQQRRGRCHRPCPARSRVGVTRQVKPACNASTGVRQAGCRRGPWVDAEGAIPSLSHPGEPSRPLPDLPASERGVTVRTSWRAGFGVATRQVVVTSAVPAS